MDGAEITAQRPRLSEKFLHNSSITLGPVGADDGRPHLFISRTASPFPRDVCVYPGQNARGLSSRVTHGGSRRHFIVCNAFPPGREGPLPAHEPVLAAVADPRPAVTTTAWRPRQQQRE